ncbi:MAG: MBL fold metallo-hydrolase [Chloroflexota bacterium]
MMPIRKRYECQGVTGAKVGRFNWSLTSTFIIYRIGGTLIDCGPTNQWRVTREFVSEAPVKELLLTHHHEDHSGNAAKIAKANRLVPYAPELGRKKLANGFRIPLIQQIIWGKLDPVETQPLPQQMTLVNGMNVTAVHTPGHAKDLHCLYFPEPGWLFTADMFIARKIKMLRSDENLQHLMDSLEKLITLDFDVIFCAHRGPVEEGAQPLIDKLNNLKQLCYEAQSLHEKGASVEQIVVELLGPEEAMARSTGLNISKRNMIREALKVEI